MRLNKFIADAGYCSRRQADEYIEQGRVTVNNRDAKLGDMVKQGDEVRVDGENVGTPPTKATYLLFNKPAEVTTSLDPKDREGLGQFFDHRERLMPIGHLDSDDEGLLIMTNDGALVSLLQKDDHRFVKRYIVTLDKPVSESFLHTMQRGVRLKSVMVNAHKVEQQGDTTLIVELRKEEERQIRRMCGALGYRALRVKRIAMLGIELGNLQIGGSKELTPAEVGAMEREIRTIQRGGGSGSGADGGGGSRGGGGRSRAHNRGKGPQSRAGETIGKQRSQGGGRGRAPKGSHRTSRNKRSRG